MNTRLICFTLAAVALLLQACSGSEAPNGSDLPPVERECRVGSRTLKVGDRRPAGDGCNWCECRADGSTVCTKRTCSPSAGCMYAGAAHKYGERFPSSNGCNECVCAASGLACTRLPCSDGQVHEEGAILLGGLTEPCGNLPWLTGAHVLSYVRPEGYHAPFGYQRSAMYFPEILPDTRSHVRVAYDSGFVVCRIPAPGQEAIDMEVEVEVLTDDGAFDEGLHAYLRRTNSKFVDNAHTVASVESWSELSGAYDPRCRDALGITFEAELHSDGSARGGISKVCEVDIVTEVGSWAVAAR
jgi:hypothetical protein